MAKEKKDLIIFGETYKNIDVNTYGGSYTLDTTGIAQVIKQYVKNKFGDIKVWAKSSSYSMGSSINIYLWNVPQEWYKQVKDFAQKFGQYNEYDGGDGIWKGRKVDAQLTDGTKIGNWSPIIFVNNTPPYGSKEEDMPPPNYNEKPTPKKKEYQRKGGKYSPTDNLDLVLDCGNGWKIYVGKPKEKYLYNVVKDGDTQPNREQWAEIKSDMLEAGFMWGYKSGTFQRWTTMPDDTIPQKACDVLSKYWAGASQPKEETPKEPQIILQGTAFELMEDDNTLKKGDTGVFADDYYVGNTYVEAYMNSEARPDWTKLIPFKKIRIIDEMPKEEIPEKEILRFYLNESVVLNANTQFKNKFYSIGTKGNIVSLDYDKKEASVYFENNGVTVPNIPFRYIDKYVTKEETPKEENPKEETPKEDGKIPLVKVVDVWGQFGTPNKEFTNFEDLEKEFFQTEIPAEGYDKYKFKFEWADGSYIIDRIDVGYSESDFNPSVRTFEDYVDYLYNTSSEKISVFYEYEMKEPFNRYSTKFSNEPKEEKPKEFKVGDKVRLVKDIDKKYYSNNQELELGDIGIVKNREGYLNMYDVEFNGKEIYLDSSYFELVEKAPTKEVNLDQYIDDLNLLLELTPNESKKLELATYISDLNTLKLLQ